MHGLGCSETKVHTKIHFSDYISEELGLCAKQKPEKVAEPFLGKVLVKQASLCDGGRDCRVSGSESAEPRAFGQAMSVPPAEDAGCSFSFTVSRAHQYQRYFRTEACLGPLPSFCSGRLLQSSLVLYK